MTLNSYLIFGVACSLLVGDLTRLFIHIKNVPCAILVICVTCLFLADDVKFLFPACGCEIFDLLFIHSIRVNTEFQCGNREAITIQHVYTKSLGEMILLLNIYKLNC